MRTIILAAAVSGVLALGAAYGAPAHADQRDGSSAGSCRQVVTGVRPPFQRKFDCVQASEVGVKSKSQNVESRTRLAGKLPYRRVRARV